MLNFKKNFYLIFLFFILSSCGAFSEAGKVLRNEKTNTTDEFLVKKKEPLTLPPDYDKIPKPGSIDGNKKKDTKKIEKILSIKKDKNSRDKVNSSVEESILNKIGK